MHKVKKVYLINYLKIRKINMQKIQLEMTGFFLEQISIEK